MSDLNTDALFAADPPSPGYGEASPLSPGYGEASPLSPGYGEASPLSLQLRRGFARSEIHSGTMRL